MRRLFSGQWLNRTVLNCILEETFSSACKAECDWLHQAADSICQYPALSMAFGTVCSLCFLIAVSWILKALNVNSAFV